MGEKIEILQMGETEYAVTITEGHTETNHHVTVPEQLLQSLGLSEADAERLVRESFAFLLEREPATSILREFGLDVIGRYFPDYEAEMRVRMLTA